MQGGNPADRPLKPWFVLALGVVLGIAFVVVVVVAIVNPTTETLIALATALIPAALLLLFGVRRAIRTRRR